MTAAGLQPNDRLWQEQRRAQAEAAGAEAEAAGGGEQRRTIQQYIKAATTQGDKRIAMQLVYLWHTARRGRPLTDYAAAPALLETLGLKELSVGAHWSLYSGNEMLQAMSDVLEKRLSSMAKAARWVTACGWHNGTKLPAH